MKTFVRYLLAVSYFTFLMYVVFFAKRRAVLTWEEVKEYANIIPIKSKIEEYNRVETRADAESFYSNLAGNIILFMPYPFVMALFLNRVHYKKLLLSGLLISLFIETTQLTLVIGVPDIDDIILNTLGTFIGVSMLYIAETVTGKRQKDIA